MFQFQTQSLIVQSIDKYKPDAELKSKRLRVENDEDTGARKKRKTRTASRTPMQTLKTRTASQTAIQTLEDQIYQDPPEETQPSAGAFNWKIFDSRTHK